MTAFEPRQLSISEAARKMDARELSAIDLAASVLEQMDRLGDTLNAFITRRQPEEVIRDASASDWRRSRGLSRGALDGIPIGIKDNFATEDLRTTAGSRMLADWVPDRDAEAVRRLRDAGAIVVGKTNMYEWAHSATDNPHYGVTPNPWDLHRVTGGSSSGSASALAADMCLGATGSDTGGSIRIPAAFCGVVGLKPTFGLIGRSGVTPTSWSLDHVGTMGRTVADTALLLSVMAGPDAGDPGCLATLPFDDPVDDRRGVEDMVIGIETSYFFKYMEPGVRTVLDEALRVLIERGATVESFELPILESSLSAELAIVFPEASAVHRANMENRLQDFGEGVRRSLLAGRLYRAVDYVEAQRVRAVISRQLNDVFRRVDAIVTPAVIVEAPRFGENRFELEGTTADVLHTFIRCLIPFNLTGHPAISVPFGYGEGGMPVGVQVAGPAFAESQLFRVATALEEDFAPRRRHPSTSTADHDI